MAANKRLCLFAVLLLAVCTVVSIFTTNSAVAPPASAAALRGPTYPPAFAYYIAGGPGHKDRLLRLLLAVYHPRNRYLLQLSREAHERERLDLATAVRAVPAVQEFGNADVVGRADAITKTGASTLAATLHAAAVLLRLDGGWDWFITLSSMDYPLVTQDDLSHVLSSVPRDLNFIDHTSDLGWKEHQRVQPIVVDSAIYLGRMRNKIFRATETRPTPDAFKFIIGSPWVMLSRPFLEYCIMGWDNLPRTLLLYFNNVILSEEGYFHSVLCNSPDFKNKSLNNDLRYVVWDNPPGMEPHFLNLTDYEYMVESGAAFARQFHENDAVLDKVDDKILRRSRDRVTPGAWCSGRSSWWMDPCSKFGDVNAVRPGLQAQNFGYTVSKLLESWESQSGDSEQCR